MNGDEPPSTGDRLRIALLSTPQLPVPPPRYAGTERVVAALAQELARRGHAVTLLAPGDSRPACALLPTIRQSLWSTGYRGDVAAHISISLARAWAVHEQFDVIHSHVETLGLLVARLCPTPVVSTLHGRLDGSGVPELLDEFDDVPLVAISDSQRRWSPRANWVATIHHGLRFADAPPRTEPRTYLALVGRVAPEKGIAEAIELARMTGLRVRLAAKAYDDAERDLFDRVVRPAIDEGVVEYLGEVGPGERDELLAGALATVMLGAWPEPFGLVAIESLALGTPVIARRAGALPELIEHHVDGFLVDDLDEARLAVDRAAGLDRAAIQRRARTRFSVERMTDAYEAVYRALVSTRRPAPVRTSTRAALGVLANDDPAAGAMAADPGPVAEPVVADPRAG